MIKSISIKNLKSIKEQSFIELKPITVLYGPNGSGKSTFINAFAIFKNIISNPNQLLDNLFNFGAMNLGGFEQVIFDHDAKKEIELKIISIEKEEQVEYRINLSKELAQFSINYEDSCRDLNNMRTRPSDLEAHEIKLIIDAKLPYQFNQKRNASYHDFKVEWNGVFAQISISIEDSNKLIEANKLAKLLNSPIENLKAFEFVNLKRGFSSPFFSEVAVFPFTYREEEVATMIVKDKYLEDKISHYLEQISQHDFRTQTQLGTPLFLLKCTDKNTGLSTELVNEGFGINQIVYMLAKSLRTDISTVCIEEPEIHLHPKMIRALANALIDISREESKSFIISTHSEFFVSALLSAVSANKLLPEDIACYLCTKKKKESAFEYQSINKKGQIEGGLSSFMEGEMEDLKAILGAKRKGK